MYSPNKVCEILDCSRSTLYRLVKKGDIMPPVQLRSRRVGYLKCNIDSFAKKQKNYFKKTPGIFVLTESNEVVLRPKKVCEILDVSRASLERMVKNGLIERPIKLNGSHIGYLKSSIESFLRSRVEDRDGVFVGEMDIDTCVVFRPKTVCKILDCSKSTLERIIKAKQIVKPIKLSERSVGFLQSDIASFINRKVIERDKAYNL